MAPAENFVRAEEKIMIIDFHVHIAEEKSYSKSFRQKVFAHRKNILSEEDFKKFKMDGRAERLIEDMDEAGIDASVCLGSDLAFLTQEEPEAHLHPCAIRTLFNSLSAIKGQKIISSHYTIDAPRISQS